MTAIISLSLCLIFKFRFTSTRDHAVKSDVDNVFYLSIDARAVGINAAAPQQVLVLDFGNDGVQINRAHPDARGQRLHTIVDSVLVTITGKVLCGFRRFSLQERPHSDLRRLL
ncbi:hypothetical protein EDD18DRAFT_1361126 [Armillaria luteobubalina]|uniref:Uncharacterized protein n=1 Tax=Armillaria luteobubalina TaxID=153913 RepID=A0AA39PK95_9AGAR|nr:hypothetical protein EDD18DRAFT_1361126 [Armillaria luteobubalina]